MTTEEGKLVRTDYRASNSHRRRGGEDTASPGIALSDVWDKESGSLPEQPSMARLAEQP